jgi:hypothetical protein
MRIEYVEEAVTDATMAARRGGSCAVLIEVEAALGWLERRAAGLVVRTVAPSLHLYTRNLRAGVEAAIRTLRCGP